MTKRLKIASFTIIVTYGLGILQKDIGSQENAFIGAQIFGLLSAALRMQSRG